MSEARREGGAGGAGSAAAPLAGRVAVVAGATRGAGRGIARMLGEAGATVYCAGRSTRARPASPQRPETIEETAELVSAVGGRGIPAEADFLVADQVRRLFERVRAEAGRLDVLVNDIWGGDPLTEWGRSFWELDPDKTRRLLDTALHTHILGARFATPLMLERGSGLIVEVTDGDQLGYRSNLAYDLAKLAPIRLAYAMACELEGTGVTALAVTPGFLRSEAMLDHFGVSEPRWRDAIAKDPHFAESETPCFVGRAVAALAADPDVARRAGRVYASWTLAREYGFDDVDGRRPDIGGHFERHTEQLLASAAPLGPDDRFFLKVRALQLDFDASQAELRARIRERLAAGSGG